MRTLSIIESVDDETYNRTPPRYRIVHCCECKHSVINERYEKIYCGKWNRECQPDGFCYRGKKRDEFGMVDIIIDELYAGSRITKMERDRLKDAVIKARELVEEEWGEKEDKPDA